MKLNHLNLTVPDVPATARFLETYFGLRPRGGGNSMAFLSDDNGMVITLMKSGRAEEPRYPSTFHIGFIQESAEHVDAINRRLREDGYEVPPPSHQHGSWTFYFRSPGGFTIEVLY